MSKICNDLIEAYKGFYEDELISKERIPTDQENAAFEVKMIERIRSNSPKERLDTYLQWNGIIGWTNRIWELSQGEL